MKRIVLFISLLVLAIGCSGSGEDSTGYKVGAVLPLTGGYSPAGLSAKAALEDAIEPINYYLRSSGISLSLEIEDSAGDSSRALSIVQAMHARGIRAIIGPMSSNEVSAVLGYANANQLLLISAGSTATQFSQDDNLFRLVLPDSEAALATSLFAKERNVSAIIPLAPTDPYGESMSGAIQSAAAAQGISVPSVISYAPSSADYSSTISALLEASNSRQDSSTAVFLIGSPEDATKILKAAAAAQAELSRLQWFSSDGYTGTASVLSDGQAAAFAAAVALTGFNISIEDTSPSIQRQATVTHAYQRLRATPSPFVLPSADAIWTVAETYRTAGASDFGSFRSAFIETVNRTTSVTGIELALNSSGDLSGGVYTRYAVSALPQGGYRWGTAGTFIHSPGTEPRVRNEEAAWNPADGVVARIGTLLSPLSDDRAAVKAAEQSARLALREATEYYAARQLNQACELVEANTAETVEESQQSLATLSSNGANVIVGPLYSTELKAMEAQLAASDVFSIAPISTAPSLAKDDTIVRLTTEDTGQAHALARLVSATGIDKVFAVHREDNYGTELAAAFSEDFSGETLFVPYPETTENFVSVIETLAGRLQESSGTTSAVLVIGLAEVASLLRQIPNDSILTKVSWFGTDGIALNRELISDPASAATAAQVSLTCSQYDPEADDLFSPALERLNYDLEPQIGARISWDEISVYDAVWLAAHSLITAGPAASGSDLAQVIKDQRGTNGMGTRYRFNSAGDQTEALFSFFSVKETSSGFSWSKVARYRDTTRVEDRLDLLE